MFATMVTYVLDGHLMNASAIFVTFGLFSSMRLTIMIGVPFGIQLMSETLVAIRRIQVFAKLVNIFSHLQNLTSICLHVASILS